jgi:UDP-N-acetyl-D-mannosaminuronate dehydrogenase
LGKTIAVIGLGEVGRPLYELIEQTTGEVVGIDVTPVDLPAPGTVSVMHVCIPFEIDDFVGETARYFDLLRPELTVINSTVAVGTTREVHERIDSSIVHSPIRGKHARMLQELTRYDKFIGPIDGAAGTLAKRHFESLGMTTRVLSSPEATELAKLTETTYFGILIAWAQEVERYCDRFGLEYDEVVAIYEEVGYLPPVKFFPGVIGGHCVMSNIELLKEIDETPFLQALQWSNDAKVDREASVRVGGGESLGA